MRLTFFTFYHNHRVYLNENISHVSKLSKILYIFSIKGLIQHHVIGSNLLEFTVSHLVEAEICGQTIILEKKLQIL